MSNSGFSALSDLIRAVDRPDFYNQFVHAMLRSTKAQGVSAYLFTRGAPPQARIQHIPRSTLGEREVPTSAYRDWAYRIDPLYLAYASGEPGGAYALSDLAPNQSD